MRENKKLSPAGRTSPQATPHRRGTGVASRRQRKEVGARISYLGQIVLPA